MTEDQVRRQRWLSHLKSFASSQGELHPYGSELWCALPDRSWRKIAAAAVAGECWAGWWDDLPTRLEDELRAEREWQQGEDARFAAYNQRLSAQLAWRPKRSRITEGPVLTGDIPLGRGQRYEGWLRWRNDELRRMQP